MSICDSPRYSTPREGDRQCLGLLKISVYLCCPMQESPVTCGYWTLERWLVQIDMDCKYKIYTAFQRVGMKNIAKYLIEIFILIIFWNNNFDIWVQDEICIFYINFTCIFLLFILVTNFLISYVSYIYGLYYVLLDKSLLLYTLIPICHLNFWLYMREN